MAGTMRTNSKSSNSYYHKPIAKRKQEWYAITKRLISMNMIEDARQAHEFYQSYGGKRDFDFILSKCIKSDKGVNPDVER